MELLVYPTLVLSVGKDYPELGYGNKPPRLKHWISFTAQAIQNILGVGGRVFFKLGGVSGFYRFVDRRFRGILFYLADTIRSLPSRHSLDWLKRAVPRVHSIYFFFENPVKANFMCGLCVPKLSGSLVGDEGIQKKGLISPAHAFVLLPSLPFQPTLTS